MSDAIITFDEDMKALQDWAKKVKTFIRRNERNSDIRIQVGNYLIFLSETINKLKHLNDKIYNPTQQQLNDLEFLAFSLRQILQNYKKADPQLLKFRFQFLIFNDCVITDELQSEEVIKDNEEIHKYISPYYIVNKNALI